VTITSPFPPAPPTIAGDVISIDQWLVDPLRVTQTLRDLTLERFLADQIFTPGGRASGGAVIYDQILGNELYSNRDVQAIEPGSEFPLVEGTDVSPLVARTTKWGGAFILTYEARDRDRRDLLGQKLTQLRNTIVRKVDTVAVATLRAAPILQATASGNWSDPDTNIFSDTTAARAAVSRQDLGYEIDTALISPNTELGMVNNDRLQNLLPRENQGAPNPIMSGQLGRLAGITRWFVSNRVGDDEVFFLSGRNAGSISDERPLYSRQIDQPEYERWLVQAARLTVPYVSNPKSVVRVTGINS
jgi:hypothetical protein